MHTHNVFFETSIHLSILPSIYLSILSVHFSISTSMFTYFYNICGQINIEIKPMEGGLVLLNHTCASQRIVFLSNMAGNHVVSSVIIGGSYKVFLQPVLLEIWKHGYSDIPFPATNKHTNRTPGLWRICSFWGHGCWQDGTGLVDQQTWKSCLWPTKAWKRWTSGNLFHRRFAPSFSCMKFIARIGGMLGW